MSVEDRVQINYDLAVASLFRAMWEGQDAKENQRAYEISVKAKCILQIMGFDVTSRQHQDVVFNLLDSLKDEL